MIKSKRLVFVVVIVLATLILFGNLAAPVQAVTANLGTPTPTDTPITDPNGQGEPVHPEQQEALKAVIQAYFEIRYDARSMSHPYGFQLHGFGNLVSNGPDAEVFLDAELGKLALERKYAEINRSRYVAYKYFLDFSNFTIDIATQLITVSVVEDSEIIYEISAERNPADPHVARMYGVEHKITLRNEQGQWKIVSDYYNDFLWRTMRETGESAQDTLSMLSTIEVAPISESRNESIGIETVSVLPDDPSSHPYDRDGAAFYAFSHAAPDVYNLDYLDFGQGDLGGDCTNFVSQAIYEGGKASMDVEPTPALGGNHWYYLNDQQRARAWVWVDSFYEFVTTPNAWSEGPEGYDLEIISGPVPEGQWPTGLMKGDVIQYLKDYSDSIWDHSAIVVDFDSVSGAPLVASHTPNWPSVDFTAVVEHVETRFIHIERSDGYPQIRIETASAADDAGGNPSTCSTTNWDPGLNYLGGCLNIVSPTGVTSGFLFRNVQIPRGAQIKYAYATFTTDGTYTVRLEDPGIYEPISVSIAGENAATPADFSSTNRPDQRANLTSPILWPINRTDDINRPYDTWYWKGQRTTPSISPIIQTITGLPDWTSGRTLSLIFKNGTPDSTYARRVIAYEYSTAANERYSPARLIVAYDMTTSSATLNSGAAQDGMVVESSENSGRGGMYNADSWLFNVGDNSENKQSRGILHFNTSSLPPTAVITSVVLKIKQYYISGTDPFTTHGNLVVDIKKPYFGKKADLAASDFEDPAGLAAVAIFEPVASDNWYSAILNSNAYSLINLTGTTQFRLAFTLEDNNDMSSDLIQFYSGNDTNVENRPQLIVTYYVP